MELKRIIHPIGQGAFYTEELCFNGKYFNAVYDCGSITDKNILENRIDSYLDNLKKQQNKEVKPVIDIVFISHFHNDHTNEIDYILTNADVQLLVLPQLNNGQILESFIYNYYSTKNIDNISNNLLSILVNKQENYPYKDNNIRTKIKYISIVKEEQRNNSKDFIIVSFDEVEKKFTVSYSNVIPKDSNDFLYIPYNLNIKEKTDKFIKFFIKKVKEFYDKDKNFQKELQKKGIQKGNIDNIVNNINLELLKHIVESMGISKCKHIYTEFFKNDHNSYSMPVFSGLNYKNSYRILSLINRKYCKCCFYGCIKNTSINNLNCLYTGDYEAEKNFDSLQKFYNNLNLWKTIKTIQVPHHCSRNNYHPDLYSNIFSCFISIGTTNTYGHPNIDTLTNIQNKICDVNIITENPLTEKIYNYLFKE